MAQGAGSRGAGRAALRPRPWLLWCARRLCGCLDPCGRHHAGEPGLVHSVMYKQHKRGNGRRNSPDMICLLCSAVPRQGSHASLTGASQNCSHLAVRDSHAWRSRCHSGGHRHMRKKSHLNASINACSVVIFDTSTVHSRMGKWGRRAREDVKIIIPGDGRCAAKAILPGSARQARTLSGPFCRGVYRRYITVPPSTPKTSW